jgi:hypothetical protein
LQVFKSCRPTNAEYRFVERGRGRTKLSKLREELQECGVELLARGGAAVAATG